MSKKSSTFAPDLGAANEPAQFVSSSEGEILKSQNVISNSIKMGARKRPYAFTEHGIIMLASVLKSETAIDASIRITRIFVSMRKTLASMTPLLARIAEAERRQLEEKTARLTDQRRNEERFDTIFKAMDGGDFPPQKVFYEGRHYEAYSFAKKLVRRATKSIVLVDGYCDDVTLDIPLRRLSIQSK